MAEKTSSSNEESEYEEEEEAEEEESEINSESEIDEEDDGLPEERESGDGQEQPHESKEKLDDDEDRKNPAYVPRRGMFYEHDQRNSVGDNEAGEKERPRKKLWVSNDRWVHDKFDPIQQAPKSRDELMSEYGYDIRAQDQPPEDPPKNFRGRRGPQRPRFGDFMQNRRGNHGRRIQNDSYRERNDYPSSQKEVQHKESRESHSEQKVEKTVREVPVDSSSNENRTFIEPNNRTRENKYHDSGYDQQYVHRGNRGGRPRRANHNQYGSGNSRQWVNSKYSRGDYRFWSKNHSEKRVEDSMQHVEEGLGDLNLQADYEDVPENFVEEEGGRDQHASSTRNEPQRIKRYSYQRQRGGTDDMTAINPLPPPHQPVVMTSGYFPPVIFPGGAFPPPEHSPGRGDKSFSPQHAIVQPPILYTVPGAPGNPPIGPSPVLYPTASIGPTPPTLVNSAGFGSPAVIGYQPPVPSVIPSHIPMSFSSEQQPPPDQIQIRGGTTYFNPHVQQANVWQQQSSRRVKMAIPIVNPQEGGKKNADSKQFTSNDMKQHLKERYDYAHEQSANISERK